MDKFEIVEKFRVEHSDAVALTDQLRERLADFINNASSGTRLPPERLLAEVLNVSRVTVRNAMMKFYESGRITRNGRRGTFVAEPVSRSIPPQVHPMALGMPNISNFPCTLKLSLHENIPYQKKFWETAVALFNRQNRLTKIDISWLPNHIHPGNMQDYLRGNPVDIIQVQLMREMASFGQATPASLHHKLLSSEYCSSNYTAESIELFKYIVPIHQNTCFTFWNKTLAHKIGLRNIRARLQKGKILELFSEATEMLPKEIFTAGHIWDWAALQGIPKNLTLSTIKEYVTGIFDQLTPCVGNKRMFMTSQTHSFDAIERFIAGHQLFLNNMPSHLFAYGKDLDFELGTAPFPMDSGNLVYSSAMGFCVSPSCSFTEKAFEFIDFMLTPEIQNLLAEMKMVHPFLRSSQAALAKTTGIKLKDLTEFTNHNRVDVSLQSLLSICYCMMTRNARPELRDIMEEKTNATDAAESFAAKLNNTINSYYIESKK